MLSTSQSNKTYAKQTEDQPSVPVLAGTLTGTTDGTIADVAAVSTSGGNTYADSAINTAITSINLQHKELQAKLNALISALQDLKIIND